jgi:hypothetical protein
MERTSDLTEDINERAEVASQVHDAEQDSEASDADASVSAELEDN